jgi:hypothetical protein
MSKTTWIKPNEKELVVNATPENDKYLKSLGFKKKPGRKPVDHTAVQPQAGATDGNSINHN